MFFTIFRFIIGIGLAYWLIHITLESSSGDIWSVIYQANSLLLFVALIFHGLIVSVASFRWNLLLRVQGICLRAKDLIRLTLIGVFFNISLPGAVSGDLVKMSLLAQHATDLKEETVLAVLLDRALGLFGLFLVATFVVIVSLPFLIHLKEEHRFIQVAAFVVGGGSMAGILFIALLHFRQNLMNSPSIASIIEHAKRRLPRKMVICMSRLVNALELYRRNRLTIVIAIALSVLVHCCLALNLFLIGSSVGISGLRLRDYFLAVPVANAVAAIPLTPGGIGTRDATLAMFFSSMHAQAEIAGLVPVILTLVILLWGLVGGITFVISSNASLSYLNAADFSLRHSPEKPSVDLKQS
jgi:uncharacterized protein (TIRG00374 family)